MKYSQKLVKIGNSAGLIIPSQILEKLGITIGSQLYVEQVQDKLLIAKNESEGISPEFLVIAESLADRYKETFEELAHK
jgi:antitoxin MazE